MSIILNALTVAQAQVLIRLSEIKAAQRTQEMRKKPVDLLVSHAPDMDWGYMVTVIDQFSPAAQRELIALMWLGHGAAGHDSKDWAALIRSVGDDQIYDLPARVASMPNLHRYLRHGLEVMEQDSLVMG